MKTFIFGLGFLILVSGILVLRPVPIVDEDEAIVEQGIVASISEGGVKDVLIRLENNQRRYYINRGLENGLDLKQLREQLIGKSVTIKYPDYWTPLDWDNRIRHISKLEIENEVIFNELR